MIELRSDTFTLPTAAMRHAMVEAVVGDACYGEDPTVRELEETAAERVGKQAACLMPSGTMGNLAAVLAHVPRGSKVIAGAESDIYLYEAGGVSMCGGALLAPVPHLPDGRFVPDALAAEFPGDPDDPQFALPALLCVENTQNRCGGVALPLDYLREVRAFAAARGVGVHLDGARLFNAEVASGVPAADIAATADSVQFCLSKGLSAPIGSMVAGSAEFVTRVRRVRKLLGGTMRQAGVVAAAGLIALREMTGRLAEDHANARRLAEHLADIDGVDIDPGSVGTNIVLFRVLDERLTAAEFVAAAGRAGVALTEFGHGRIRAVTHRGVIAADIDRAADVLATVLALPRGGETGHEDPRPVRGGGQQ
ncbi:GntG family PLP-dependent aldolase [Kibdelosporangium phytohabitans]|uniref:Threonine aldolase n=1 Tax=Kibdelosporangium phytohabitans TaxID=860235 RepID=A0A0N9I958_9PSEU|nr:GntG family PLP-dependent aldolase [Kibdelosporangium phytohabitans]ALG12491.1 threonine aldolase [Kibdelosporangium phytohabitans]MBE1464086.1 threonine aldolase [Kibdelosporangium phytohabitans]